MQPTKVNEILQWMGTASFMVMYTIMSFFPDQHPWNIVFGALGGGLYLIWSFRVKNKPQTITNIVGLTICLIGLFRVWG
jgi:drug/metabolite transporter superfamily protein YnfA